MSGKKTKPAHDVLNMTVLQGGSCGTVPYNGWTRGSLPLLMRLERGNTTGRISIQYRT